jgi:AcrR family transcriptional regulator
MSDPSARAERRARSPQGEGARLRDELIDAADRILARTGDEEGLSLRAVAREAGVAGPSVYLHFAGKDDLIRAVMRRHFDELRRAIEAAAAAAPGPAERLRAGCLAYCRFAVEQPGAYRVLFGNRTSGLAEPPDQGIGLDAFGTLVDGVRACMAAGAAPPGDPFRVMAVWAALHGIVGLRHSAPSFPWVPVDALVDDVLRGLVGIATGGGGDEREAGGGAGRERRE